MIQVQQGGVQLGHARFDRDLVGTAEQGEDQYEWSDCKTETFHARVTSGFVPVSGLNFAGMRA